MVNRYYAWYSNTGQTDIIPLALEKDMRQWRAKFPTKPVMLSEYGADAVAGLHSDPPFSFSEEFQVYIYMLRYILTFIYIYIYIYIYIFLFFSFLYFYGADAVAGMHSDPPFSFSEEFQVYICLYIYIIYIDSFIYIYIYICISTFFLLFPERTPLLDCIQTRHSPSAKSSRCL